MTDTEAQFTLMQEALQARKLYGGHIDGIWGTRSQEAFRAFMTGVTPNDVSAVGMVYWEPDDRSAANIATLHPKVQPVAREFLGKMHSKLSQTGITAKIISGTRTYAEQNALYEQGRSKPGRIVTNARGGYSNHNFGVAWDIGLFEQGKYLEESGMYRTVGTVAREMGLEWGGDWKTFPDEPHVQMRPDWAKELTESQMLAKLRARHDSGRDVFA